MEYIPIARPIKKWIRKSSGSTTFEFHGQRYSILTNEMGTEIERVGGMGVAYKCQVISGPHAGKKAWIKHARLDTTSKSELVEKIKKENDGNLREIEFQKYANSLGFAPEVLADGFFRVGADDPEFHLFIQEDANGMSFYDLKDKLSTNERLAVLEEYFFPAIQSLHENNMYHSDLDLDHVFFDKATGKIQFIDWGAAITARPSESKIGSKVKGKLYFSPPEQFERKEYFTGRSEVFTVGAVAYYFLDDKKNGRGADDAPHGVASGDGYDIHHPDTKLSGEIPKSVANAIMKATKHDAHERFESIEDLITAWRGSEKPNLTSLIVTNREQILSEINIENENFSHSGLNINMVGSQHNPSWFIRGNFDYFMTEGSKAGQWRTAEKLEIIDRPYIIKTDGEILLLDVRVVGFGTDDEIEEEEVETSGFEDKTTGEIYIKIGMTDDNRTILTNPLTDSTKYVTQEELDSRFIRI